MTKTLTILLLLLTLTAYGQKCDTVDVKLVNCVDASGLRQGYWELNKKKILVSGHRGYGSKDGCRYFEEAEFYPLAKGEFRDGHKVGIWEYYSGDYLASLDRKIIYYEDGSVKDDNIADHYKLDISSDTLNVSGQFYHGLDTMIIDCQNQSCLIRVSNGEEITSFEFVNMDKLKFELLRFKLGQYDREIRMKKNAR